MIIKPRIWGFICTTAHPKGCELNVREQMRLVQAAGRREDGGSIDRAHGPRRALVIGASTGYGLAARITAAFGYGAATLGLFYEKPGKDSKSGTAGWYNSAAFHALAKAAGLKAVSINGDAFSDAARERAIQCIQQDLGGPVDLVIYSLASPARRLPGSDAVAHTALKPIGEVYTGKTIDTDKDVLTEVRVEPASQEEIDGTVQVMGGEDWALWLEALSKAGCLAPKAKTIALSYIGPEVTWPIYWHGTIGRAKKHLEDTAVRLRDRGVDARVAVMKSIVTQASAAIPVIPLYVSVVFRIMKQAGLHEGAIQQMNRLFREQLYRQDGRSVTPDAQGRLRLDDRELSSEVQQACKDLWPQVTGENFLELTDYAGYKQDFLRLFGFAREDVDYTADAVTAVQFDCIQL
ncbi:MAG TPA: enoyl-ACP reductase FabV [Gammaproteobacteria bacterium]|nr:enoyl-ACP reductase FabV [Gammaproteobacteria bacterium]